MNLLITNLCYFFFFAILGIFVPFFSLYCFHLGFSGLQIAIINTVSSLLLAIVPIYFGWRADIKDSNKKLLIISGWLSAIFFIGFVYFRSFISMLFIMVIYYSFRAPMISLLESNTLRWIRDKKINYGYIRIWGSLGFCLAAILVGYILKIYSSRTVIYAIVVLSFLLAGLLQYIPNNNKDTVLNHKSFNDVPLKELIFFYSISCLIQASHAAYYNFFTIHMEVLGFNTSIIGICWGWGVLAEIIIFLLFSKIFNSCRIWNVLLLCSVATTLRWLGLFFFQSWQAIIITQTLHCLSFGVFHIVALKYIDEKNGKALGQGLYTAISYGLGLALGRLASGYIFDHASIKNIFSFSALLSFVAVGMCMYAIKKYKKNDIRL